MTANGEISIELDQLYWDVRTTCSRNSDFRNWEDWNMALRNNDKFIGLVDATPNQWRFGEEYEWDLFRGCSRLRKHR